jgi:hypothetical protein
MKQIQNFTQNIIITNLKESFLFYNFNQETVKNLKKINNRIGCIYNDKGLSQVVYLLRHGLKTNSFSRDIYIFQTYQKKNFEYYKRIVPNNLYSQTFSTTTYYNDIFTKYEQCRLHQRPYLKNFYNLLSTKILFLQNCSISMVDKIISIKKCQFIKNDKKIKNNSISVSFYKKKSILINIHRKQLVFYTNSGRF